MTRNADPVAVQSYPTFWDAIPVESRATPIRPSPADAYALFADAAEHAGPGSLSVDRVDVG